MILVISYNMQMKILFLLYFTVIILPFQYFVIGEATIQSTESFDNKLDNNISALSVLNLSQFQESKDDKKIDDI